MRTWERPALPALPGRADPPLVYDTSTQQLVAAEPDDGVATMYVCGITPYDATHMGHAATYVAFDTLQRVWRDAGYRVRYAQNITDVDDPLLERAARDGVDWRELATAETDGFCADMAALAVIPPDAYVAVTEVIDPVARAVAELLARGVAYRVPAPDALPESEGVDVYFDNTAAADVAPWSLGQESRLPHELMRAYFAERGGDPDRAGKRDELDPILWRAAREGEPAWESPMGLGRPGWHIECAVIALDELGGGTITVQGGGVDLVFPHHEYSAGQAATLSGVPLAHAYVHSGMVGYQGEKMSKSLGNLVKVAELRAAGADPRAIRLAILAHHYRSDWDWTASSLPAAAARLERWGAALTDDDTDAMASVTALRAALREDLDTPRALELVDAAAVAHGIGPTLRDAVHLLLGVDL
jgi:L-cysteine:1D-myo-inositol 2-amino-2-deoxy-alpha-D-glucopyranoside ligase